MFAFRLSSDAVYIGVHIRRADMAFDPKYTVADVGYFRRAVHLMTRNFEGFQLVFVVCSDDLFWSKQIFPDVVSREIDHVTVGFNRRINPSNESVATNATRAVVVFSENHGSEEDLAILSSCNHTIMTVGTYGWWAAYLAGGITTYYRNFPAKDSELFKWFSRRDHFPPDWIGL